MDGRLKPLVWLAASKKDFLTFPGDVINDVGHALYLAQCGDKPPNSSLSKGSEGLVSLKSWSSMMEIPIGRFTPCVLKMPFMCCTASRRNRSPERQRHNKVSN